MHPARSRSRTVARPTSGKNPSTRQVTNSCTVLIVATLHQRDSVSGVTSPDTDHQLDLSYRTLCRRDSHLAAAVEEFGTPETWERPGGYATLLLFILEQQVSLASARAVYDRLTTLTGELTPATLMAVDDDGLRSAGFSRQKIGYARALAQEVISHGVDLDSLPSRRDDEVCSALMAVAGIGPWTAEVYLLACLGRPDVWPVGDRALQVSAAETLGLDQPPDAKELQALGERWRPHRSAAARLLWHAYLARRGR